MLAHQERGGGRATCGAVGLRDLPQVLGGQVDPLVGLALQAEGVGVRSPSRRRLSGRGRGLALGPGGHGEQIGRSWMGRWSRWAGQARWGLGPEGRGLVGSYPDQQTSQKPDSSEQQPDSSDPGQPTGNSTPATGLPAPDPSEQ